MTDQPTDKALALKLAHCRGYRVQGIAVGCSFLWRGGECRYQRLREGPRKGCWPTLAELERCPREER